ncbi:hypothetical protein RHMOL_Rhmol09G0194700 [Rhododendron molle]|uniref:Uncharacterized protein n=1 Tax=Rhododendron molle TaxID=49168 RepID=A0ACC0MF44_RHOML|nr:hypothetical protein RHMOL_Rhmol09G0194700 [Rhododendron molle]
MKMLESLDLSRNRLFGKIPPTLAALNFLSVLDVSNNNLSGKIPTSTQLQSFDASVYSGNAQLCGLPLPDKCPGEEQDGKKGIQEGDDEDWFTTPAFYISLGVGFACGFWAIFGTILFSSVSRYAWFKFLDKVADRLKASIPDLRHRLLGMNFRSTAWKSLIPALSRPVLRERKVSNEITFPSSRGLGTLFYYVLFVPFMVGLVGKTTGRVSRLK